MSMYLEFEPHSWYKGYAIKKNDISVEQPLKWTGLTDDGVKTYAIVSISARTLKELKNKITVDRR